VGDPAVYVGADDGDAVGEGPPTVGPAVGTEGGSTLSPFEGCGVGAPGVYVGAVVGVPPELVASVGAGVGDPARYVG
jgi:hypothetical protein